ncbi:MAG TPA: efflux RND transporter periplasmic adaptor subunit [Pyrinomonadaceae bacterium]|jgi:RND family efflux transporter MFP subunit|nr:efflux RND transporter periplasmic adaptor subunit [Pyrinomonadaceae bacterium]
MSSLLFSRKTSAAALLVALFAATFGLAGCGGSSAESAGREGKKGSAGEGGPARADAAAPVQVSTVRVATRPVPAYIEATGSLAATESSNVASQGSGQVVSTPVNVGAFVRQGTVIARLNERDARLRLQQARAGVSQAIAGVRQAEARLGLSPGGRFDASTIPEVRSAAAAYQSALAAQRLAEANERRYAELVETGDVARSVYDQYRTTAETARQQSNVARQAMETAANLARQNNQAIQTAQADVESARAAASIAEKAVADTVIRAPYSGYVSDRPIAVGEYITPSSVVATILLTNPLKLQLQVPELEAPRVQVGMPVSASVDAYPDRKFAGRVTAVNPAVDPASRSFTVEAAIENPENALRSGMFATARITQPGGGQSVYVPSESVVRDQNTNSYRVFTVKDGAAHLKVVQIGDEENGWVQILSGVAADEEVAVNNQQQLYEGARVQAQQAQVSGQ